jgi:drug/metabolite transporter (DMT)-like permease
LIDEGLSPKDIFFYRFLLAYICIWFIGKQQLFAVKFKDELWLMLMGIAGGSFYFIVANFALQNTLPTNVALLACVAPIFTVLLSRLLLKNEVLRKYYWRGTIIALLGVVFVVFRGRFNPQISLLGDVLSLLAALSWAFYTIMLKRLSCDYSMLFITRKVFFYGLLTCLPMFLLEPLELDLDVLRQPIIWGNLLYLGIIASLLCYFLWNSTVKKLGAVRTTNYVYLSPVVTMITSVVVGYETIMELIFPGIIGASLIIIGVALADTQR